MRKLTALCLIFLMLAGVFHWVGFTGEEIRDIIGDDAPEIKFESAERIKTVIGG